jgi:predicted ATPase
MLLITGEWAGSFEETVKKPLEYARNFEDRLPALTDQARFLCSVGRHEEATEKCFSILREYGEDFPAEITPEIMQTEIAQTKMLLANFPKNNLLRLPQLEDQMKLSLMKHMTATMLMLFHRKSKYVILVGCRIAQRSASYGWSPYSAFGLYSFGQALMSIADEVDEGYSW